MAAEDRTYAHIDPAHHVESLASVGEKVKRKKEQEKQRKEKKKKDPIEEQLSEENEEKAKKVDEGHVDFRA